MKLNGDGNFQEKPRIVQRWMMISGHEFLVQCVRDDKDSHGDYLVSVTRKPEKAPDNNHGLQKNGEARSVAIQKRAPDLSQPGIAFRISQTRLLRDDLEDIVREKMGRPHRDPSEDDC